MPLSRNTVKDWVQCMASDVSVQLTTDLQKTACYSMCLDESTDTNHHASKRFFACKQKISKRFLQFCKMETTLRFLTFPDQAKFQELDLSCLYWLDLENLEMELLEFQENTMWKNKFYDLREILCKLKGWQMTAHLVLKMKFLKFGILCQIILSQWKHSGLLSFLCLDHHILVSSCFQLWIISYLTSETG